MRTANKRGQRIRAWEVMTIVEHRWGSGGRPRHEWLLLDNWGEIIVRGPTLAEMVRMEIIWLHRIYEWGQPFDY